MANNVEVRRSAKGLEIAIHHELLGKADPKIVDGCIEALLNCAAANRCLDGKLSITSACFGAIEKHNAKSRCLDACFGCA